MVEPDCHMYLCQRIYIVYPFLVVVIKINIILFREFLAMVMCYYCTHFNRTNQVEELYNFLELLGS